LADTLVPPPTSALALLTCREKRRFLENMHILTISIFIINKKNKQCQPLMVRFLCETSRPKMVRIFLRNHALTSKNY